MSQQTSDLETKNAKEVQVTEQIRVIRQATGTDERAFVWNTDATGRDDACSICGKRLRSSAKRRPFIHYLTNGNITSSLYHPQSQGFFEIGSGCAKTLPASFVHYFPAAAK